MRQIFANLTGTLTSSSEESQLAGRRLKWWIAPAILLVVIAVVGWVGNRWLESSIHTIAETQLETVLKADVKALTVWFDSHKANAQVLAANPDVAAAIEELARLTEKGAGQKQLLASGGARHLKTALKQPLKSYQYTGFAVVNPDYLILAGSEDELVGKTAPSTWIELGDEVLAGQTVVSKPYREIVLARDEAGELREDVIHMFVAAPVSSDQDRVIAAIGFAIAPGREFTEILQTAQSGKSGETYAFDEQGVMLSESRFVKQLQKIGMLDQAENATAVLNVQVRNPGVDLRTAKAQPPPPSGLPFTKMARAAIEARNNQDYGVLINADGYRDYRGVYVVGACQWLRKYDFGVATEVDYDEMYAASENRRYVFWGLFLLTALGAAGTLIYSRAVSSLNRRMQGYQRRIERLGQYQLGRKIGSGGMGEVYLADHAMLRRPTAIKLLPPARSSEKAVARFEREVQLTARLTHPNTIAIYDYGRTNDNVFYYAMEYLDGADLDRIVQRDGPQPPERVIHILVQVCGSLQEAHDLGLIHRDIKPANIILCSRGGNWDVVKVLDFGLVKDIENDSDVAKTMAGSLTGTPLFMSPESIQTPDEIDARSDLYAVGAAGYYLLTGRHVFDGRNPMEVCRRQIDSPPTPPSQHIEGVPSDLEEAILQCLAKRPEDRPPSAAALAQQLSQCGLGQSWTAESARQWWSRFEVKSDQETLGEPASTAALPATLSVDTRSLLARRP